MQKVDVVKRPGILEADTSTTLLSPIGVGITLNLDGRSLVVLLLEVIVVNGKYKMTCFDDAAPPLVKGSVSSKPEPAPSCG